MGGLRALALAVALLAAASGARAECPPGAFHYEPTFGASFKSYAFPASLLDPVEGFRSTKARTAKICPDCPEKRRGVQLAAARSDGFGFSYGVFQVPVALGPSFCLAGLLDLSRASGPGHLAGFEFDSPAVGIGTIPTTFVFVGAMEDAGVRTLFVDVSGTPGGTLDLPQDVRSVEVELHHGSGLVDVFVRPVGEPGFTQLVNDQPFAYAGSGAVLGTVSALAKGDRVGFGVELTGEIFGSALQAVLEELAALAALAEGALADLEAAATADARAKLEEARARLEALVPGVEGLPATKATRSAAKRLGKAAGQVERARDLLDLGTPEGAEKAGALAGKALVALGAASRILETGVVAEG
jgi:hypothetical protein